MNRRLISFGLVVTAVLALSGLLTTGAGADFTSGSDSTTATGKALTAVVFANSSGAEMVCTENAVQSAEIGTVQTELTIEPPITGGHCTITLPGLGTLVAKVDLNKCHFTITNSVTEVGHISCETEGATQIEATAKILGSFRKCVDVPAQTPTVGAVDVFNGTNPATGKMDVEVVSTISGITYEGTSSCAFLGHANDMTLSGSATVTGDNVVGESVDVTQSQ